PAATCHCALCSLLCVGPRPPRPRRFPYTTLFRSVPRTSTRGSRRPASTGTLTRPITTRSGRVEPRTRATNGTGIPSAVSRRPLRSEEHTSELQSRFDLVCRLLLEKKKEDEQTQRA